MSELIPSWLAAPPPQLLLLVPLLAFLESVLFVGLFVSGFLLLSTSALIYAQGSSTLPMIVTLAFIGAMMGDHVGYFVGYCIGPRLLKQKRVRVYLLKHKSGYRKFRKVLLQSAPLAICIGRLSPPTRSLSPIIAGTFGVKPARFFTYDVLACSIWAGGLATLILAINQF